MVLREHIRACDDRRVPVTPFLFIPQDGSDDGSKRPIPNSFAWMSSPSILLLKLRTDGSAELCSSPTFGLHDQYRVLVLIGNSGAAPVQNGFAEFFVFPPDYHITPEGRDIYQQTPYQVDDRWKSLGVTPFSVSGSLRGRDLAWAISPQVLEPYKLNIPYLGYYQSIAVRIFEPISDGPAMDFRSWSDRKTASKLMRVNFAGTWAGEEIDLTTGQDLGVIQITISQVLSIEARSDHSLGALWQIKFDRVPQIPWRTIDTSQPANSGRTLALHPVAAPYVIYSSGENQLRMEKSGWGVLPTEALLDPIAIGAEVDKPDRLLLARIRKVIPTDWPDTRKADAEMLYQAILDYDRRSP
jgi:hypothetical protein